MPELVLAFFAGLLTLINPCVLPVLPIAMASALGASRLGPLTLCAGMACSFTAAGIAVTAFGSALGISADGMSIFGALLMAAFGLFLLIPRFSGRFALATAGFAGSATRAMAATDRLGLPGQFAGGVLLGLVWSPCIGPTLGGAIALASQGAELGRTAAIMAAFSLGVSAVMLSIAYAGRALLGKDVSAWRTLAAKSRPVLGATFLAVGIAILFGLHHMAEQFLVERLPTWLQDLSVSI